MTGAKWITGGSRRGKFKLKGPSTEFSGGRGPGLSVTVTMTRSAAAVSHCQWHGVPGDMASGANSRPGRLLSEAHCRARHSLRARPGRVTEPAAPAACQCHSEAEIRVMESEPGTSIRLKMVQLYRGNHHDVGCTTAAAPGPPAAAHILRPGPPEPESHWHAELSPGASRDDRR